MTPLCPGTAPSASHPVRWFCPDASLSGLNSGSSDISCSTYPLQQFSFLLSPANQGTQVKPEKQQNCYGHCRCPPEHPRAIVFPERVAAEELIQQPKTKHLPTATNRGELPSATLRRSASVYSKLPVRVRNPPSWSGCFAAASVPMRGTAAGFMPGTHHTIGSLPYFWMEYLTRVDSKERHRSEAASSMLNHGLGIST